MFKIHQKKKSFCDLTTSSLVFYFFEINLFFFVDFGVSGGPHPKFGGPPPKKKSKVKYFEHEISEKSKNLQILFFSPHKLPGQVGHHIAFGKWSKKNWNSPSGPPGWPSNRITDRTIIKTYRTIIIWIFPANPGHF